MSHPRRKSVVIFLTGLIVLIGAGAVYLMVAFFSFTTSPLKPEYAPETVFMILPGQGLKTIALNLEKNGVVKNGSFFALYARYKKVGNRLQAGEYLLSAAQSPEQILDILAKGRVRLHKITVPEGFTMKEVAELADAGSFCGREKFLNLCRDPLFIAELGIDADTLEGYLFPDTYFFSRQNTCEDIIRTMVRHFNVVFIEEWRNRARETGLSIHETVTLASIVEKETGDASERPIISSVFHNRLKRNMRLESDPTVIYGIDDFDGNIRRIHLQTPTPYNTYQISGLPPGPIANPGALSLKAALYPADTRYLYFVSRKDATHYFSKTYEEHLRAVRKYQLEP